MTRCSLIALWLGLSLACEDPFPDARERRPPRTPDTDLGDAHDTADTGIDTGIPGPDTQTVCYLGPDRADDQCHPTLPWQARWGPDWRWPASADPRYAHPTHLLDLDREDPATPLAPNFQLVELAEAWKGRWGIVQPRLIDALQAIRDDVGPVIVNSGFRHPAYNQTIGGATFSRHMYGDAADIRAPAVSLSALGARCEAEGAGYVQYYASHVHCDWRDDDPSTAFFSPVGAPQKHTEAHPRPQLRAHLERRGPTWSAPAEGWDEGEPLREWQAWSADGAPIASLTATTFTPPDGTHRVTVLVGRVISLDAIHPR